MTPEELDAIFPEPWDDRYHHELIRGVITVPPFASPGEPDSNREPGRLLRCHAESRLQVVVLDVTLLEQMISTANRRRRDRAISSGLGWIPKLGREIPTIVVESASASKRDVLRDRERKRDESLSAGIRESWVIDRFRRALTVLRPGPNGFHVQAAREKESSRTDLLPGFSLPLARLLKRADRWSR